MFQITDEKTVRSVVRQNGIDRYFETPDIRFRLFHFHKGEYLASPDLRSEYIQFITKGEISIFHIGEDGTIYSLAHTNGIFLLGDMQFITPEEVPAFYAEARTEAETVAVSLQEYRTQLKKDSRFLYLLVEILSRKLILLSTATAENQNLNQRVLNYIRFSCPDGCLKGVEQAAFHLHCSSRHLQRILNTMEADGVLRKVGKGCYSLLN